VLLTLTAFPLEPCDTISDNKILNIQKLPTVEAGNDQTICEDEPAILFGEAANFVNLQWTTNGDGYFENSFALQTFYYPGANDIILQQVMLQLTANTITPCLGNFFDQLTVSIVNLPTVNAGEDVTIAADELLQLSASATNYSALHWSSSGDGSFSAIDILNPVYTPGIQDIQNAGVTLELAGFPVNPCIEIVLDALVLTIDTLTAISAKHLKPELKVFPNPASTEIFVEGSQLPGQLITILFFDHHGRLMLNQVFENHSFFERFLFRISTEKISNGLIFIRIQSGDFVLQRKLIIIKS
jgi:hypothetical protein